MELGPKQNTVRGCSALIPKWHPLSLGALCCHSPSGEAKTGFHVEYRGSVRFDSLWPIDVLGRSAQDRHLGPSGPGPWSNQGSALSQLPEQKGSEAVEHSPEFGRGHREANLILRLMGARRLRPLSLRWGPFGLIWGLLGPSGGFWVFCRGGSNLFPDLND